MVKPADLLPEVLPVLKKNLEIAFDEYNLDGDPQWTVYDPEQNKFFMIGWAEYELIKRWDKQKPALVLESVNTETTLQVDENDLLSLLKFLSSHYLIEQGSRRIKGLAKSQKLFMSDDYFHWIITNYLFFRVPLFHPDKFLTRTKRFGSFLFHPVTAAVMLVLLVVALYQIGVQWEEFTHTFQGIFTWNSLFLYFIAFTVCKVFHELGHAYMCKRYGVSVPTMGIAFLVFWPVLYTDTTLSWRLRSNKRIRIALAGLWVEGYVTILAAIVWSCTYVLTLKTICFLIITVNWALSLLINASPFTRFDGYYVLADLLRMPNLQMRAFALTRWQIRRWLFDWPDPPPEDFSRRLHSILIIYSILTWLYRLVLYFAIALLVYHYFTKILGILLFVFEIYILILKPIYLELRLWARERRKFSVNNRMLITLSVTLFFGLVFFTSFSHTLSLPATLSNVHQFIYAPEEGVLQSALPASGTAVKANQPLVKINSMKINQEVEVAQLEYKKASAQLRRSVMDDKYSKQTFILRSALVKLNAKLEKLLASQEKMTVKAPFNGVVVEVASDLHPGEYVKKNEWLGDVIDTNKLQVEAYVSQFDAGLLKKGMSGYFYSNDSSETNIAVKVVSIDKINRSKLVCQYSKEVVHGDKQAAVVETPCYQASDLGGDVSVLLSKDGEFVPVESVYLVLLEAEEPVDITHIERGKVVVTAKQPSYAMRAFYAVREVLLQEVSF